MKNTFKLILVLFTLFNFINCTKENKIPADLEINDFVWKAMNAYYLHQDQVDDLANTKFRNQPELNQYLRSFETPKKLFLSLLYNTPALDQKSLFIEDYNSSAEVDSRISSTHGVEYGIIAEPGSSSNVIGYVQYILPNTDASKQPIQRGDFFYAVDNIQLTRNNFNTLLNNASNTFELHMASFDGNTVKADSIIENAIKIPKKITLSKKEYLHTPIFMHKTITDGSNKTGYIVFNHQFSSNYIQALNARFLQFKNDGVKQLILDLRYNIGGRSSLKSVNELASMITGQFTNEIFAKKRFNNKAQSWFMTNQPDSLVVRFTDKIYNSTKKNRLKLTELYIILNGNSPAAELLINGLNNHINVYVINSVTTKGENTASMKLYNSLDYNKVGSSTNHTVALEPIVAELQNSNDETFANGFTPKITTCSENDILNIGIIGESSDPVLNRVLNLIQKTPPNPPGICNPNRFTFLYNSIHEQKAMNSGIFMQQKLPNTD